MKKFLSVVSTFVILTAMTVPAMSGDLTSTSEADALSKSGFVGDVGSNNKSIGAPIPGGTQFGPVINYFGQPLPSEGFQPVEELTMYVKWFTEGALEKMSKATPGAEADFAIANDSIALAKPAKEDGKTRWIKVYISKKPYVAAGNEPVGFRGWVTGRSDDKETNMTAVFGKTALEAVKAGCNVLHISAQGASRDAHTSGWGIGLNTTQAQVYSGDMSKSNASSAGTGYSNADAGTRDKPWLQAFGLVDNNLEYPAMHLAVTVKDNKITKNEAPASTVGAQVVANNTPQTGNHTKFGTIQ